MGGLPYFCLPRLRPVARRVVVLPVAFEVVSPEPGSITASASAAARLTSADVVAVATSAAFNKRFSTSAVTSLITLPGLTRLAALPA